MRILQKFLSFLAFAVLLLAPLVPALRVQAADTLAHGTVISLQGTPHLWFADAGGALHWGGDSRALAGRHIDWNRRVAVSLEELQALEIGDPWLTAGLVKEGDPIYLVKWETDWAQPKLLHIQSWDDAVTFGLSASNYGNFVYDVPTWEAEYGFSVANLERATLEAATQPSSPAPGAPPVAPVSREAVLQRILAILGDDDDDDDDDDTDTETATATATATGDQTATATATATDDGTSLTQTATDDTAENPTTLTATATDTATATGDQTATATATATDDGTSVTETATDDTPDGQDASTTTVTDTATATGTGDQTATATATGTDDGLSATQTETDDTPAGQNVPSNTATATATATATGSQTATATATATDDGTSITITETDPTDSTPVESVSDESDDSD